MWRRVSPDGMWRRMSVLMLSVRSHINLACNPWHLRHVSVCLSSDCILVCFLSGRLLGVSRSSVAASGSNLLHQETSTHIDILSKRNMTTNQVIGLFGIFTPGGNSIDKSTIHSDTSTSWRCSAADKPIHMEEKSYWNIEIPRIRSSSQATGMKPTQRVTMQTHKANVKGPLYATCCNTDSTINVHSLHSVSPMHYVNKSNTWQYSTLLYHKQQSLRIHDHYSCVVH